MGVEVSVILPFYNAGKTLQAAADSILNQSFTNFELLLVNNNSTDNSLLVAKQLVAKDLRVRLINEPKQGVANAMNCGLANARGDFIARMDADDISLPRRLEKQLQYLQNNRETGVVGCHVKYVAHNKNTKGFERFVARVNSFHTPEAISLNRFIEIPLINPTIFFRKELFIKYGGNTDGDFPEDYEMQLRFLDAEVKMAKIPEPLLEWHDSETRLTRTDERYSTEAFFKIKAKYFYKWAAKNNPFHPKIWVWGAGRKTRQRAKLLENEGVKINGYIDVVKNKTTQKQTIHFNDIPDKGSIFIVSMVTSYGAREEIKAFLLTKKFDHLPFLKFII